MIVFEEVLDRAVSLDASDIHLRVGLPPVLRVDGALTDLGEELLTDDDVHAAARELSTDEQLETLAHNGEVDFAATYQGRTRMRLNLFHQQGHISLALRLLPLSVPTAEQLRLPKVLIEQAEKPRGLVLVTGPTGSGKSSTLAALLNYINQTRRRHIITLEAPIEFVYERDQCIINQREVGADTRSFAAGLRAALRQDPDVILVGEMRDLETIGTAITAAETGHLVFATLHTKGAPNTIDRIIDAFPADQQEQIRVQLADVIECVVGQALVPRAGGGRIAAFEILTGTPAVRNLIRQNKTFQLVSTIQTSKGQGMQLLDDALIDLVRSGQVQLTDAMAAANDAATLRNNVVMR
ncbi:MAG: type IV pilus twitching motility protein PilT [Oscillospiraceae bacterium]|nr:type IV pilus twitching motility protein PilT [Oscillospiraceae bacterium]